MPPEVEDFEVKPDDQGKYEQAYVTRLRNRIAELRTKNTELTTEKATVETERNELKKFKETTEQAELEKKGEYEKARQKLQAREREIEQEKESIKAEGDKRFVLAEAKAAAIKAGIVDANDIASVDLSDLKIDANGTITGLDDKIKAVKESKPHWFSAEGGGGSPRPGASPGSGGSGGGGGNNGVDWMKVPAEELDSKLNSILTV